MQTPIWCFISCINYKKEIDLKEEKTWVQHKRAVPFSSRTKASCLRSQNKVVFCFFEDSLKEDRERIETGFEIVTFSIPRFPASNIGWKSFNDSISGGSTVVESEDAHGASSSDKSVMPVGEVHLFSVWTTARHETRGSTFLKHCRHWSISHERTDNPVEVELS